jgi:sugar lactone lactonase YvrE
MLEQRLKSDVSRCLRDLTALPPHLVEAQRGVRQPRTWRWLALRHGSVFQRFAPLGSAIALALVVAVAGAALGLSLHLGNRSSPTVPPTETATPTPHRGTPTPTVTPFPAPGPAAWAPVRTLHALSALAVAVDASGTLYGTDADGLRVVRIGAEGSWSSLAGDQVVVGVAFGQGAIGGGSQVFDPLTVRLDSSGNLYLGFALADPLAHRGVVGGLARIGRDGKVTYLTQAGVLTPNGLAIGPDGAVYVSQGGVGLPGYSTDVRISKIDAAGTRVVVAGTGASGSGGDGGRATRAQFVEPAGLAFDGAGNLYVADLLANRVRRISPAGIITTFAGTGVAGFSGDAGPATAAQLDGPSGVAVDRAGDVYIADSKNNRIRKVAPDGAISTVAGTGVAGTGSGDGGPATSASLTDPHDLTFDPSGDLIIADTGDQAIRKVTSDGKITSVV